MNDLKLGLVALLFAGHIAAAQQLTAQQAISLDNLSAFNNPGNSWSIVGKVIADPKANEELKALKGTGILLNAPGKKNKGTDLVTNIVHGNMILELDYLMAKGSNSGIYLQGNYEIQLADSWAKPNLLSSDNGGVYERWDDSRAEGQKGFEGYAPRQNVSKAPGLWQHLKIAFQAPKFDAAGSKIAHARLLMVELNGVLIHDNLVLMGPTRGGTDREKALGPLRLQGDHGAVAFRNIKISEVPEAWLGEGQRGGERADPIYIHAPVNTMIRSFVDVKPGLRAVHAISVGSPEKLHYSYDLDKGLLLQGWHGEFIDATPMWDGRGNGTSRPVGAITRFTDRLVPAIAQLADLQVAWPSDTTGTGFRTKGYVMDNADRPEFKYNMYGMQVTDAIKVAEDGKGLSRTITLDKVLPGIYMLLARSGDIDEIGKGMYLIDGQSFYILTDAAKQPVIRDMAGKKELLMPLGKLTRYNISF